MDKKPKITPEMITDTDIEITDRMIAGMTVEEVNAIKAAFDKYQKLNSERVARLCDKALNKATDKETDKETDKLDNQTLILMLKKLNIVLDRIKQNNY